MFLFINAIQFYKFKVILWPCVRSLLQALFIVFAFAMIQLGLLPQKAKAQQPAKPYSDLTHFSKAFGHEKFYRIYLPEGYESGNDRYPVIYFFHGWGGRHFKDDNALLEYDLIGDLVDKYNLILVMWDGNIEESEPRPYNIGNHKDIKYDVQMKDYFPELVNYIDTTYRTLADRNHRGIIGFSMGGIMSFFLAGKYPQMVSAAVDLAGTPEFFIGYPDNHTLYPLRYTFKNLREVNTRQHSGDSDILVYLNDEVRKGAEWEGNPYEFYSFRGGHMVDKPGETKAFEMAMKFVTDNFPAKLPLPGQWSHYDLYADFEVWDYRVKSNKNVPGLNYLSDVSKQGFGFYTHRWLPDGPPLKNINAEILTAPVYERSKTYNYIQWAADANQISIGKVTADNQGRILFKTDGMGNEIGIFGDNDPPDFIAVKHHLNETDRLIKSGQKSRLYIDLLNRGGEISSGRNLKVSIRTSDKSIYIPDSAIQIKLRKGERQIKLPPFDIESHMTPPAHGEPYQVKLKIHMESGETAFTDEIILPVLFDAPSFDSIRIDDGKALNGRTFGKGNGDGVVNSGENVLLYNGERRLRLFTNDPWVIYSEEVLVDQQIPAIWEDGYTLSSIVYISEKCPDGHIIEFSGYYETNTWNPIQRNLHWGKAYITVRNLNTSVK